MSSDPFSSDRAAPREGTDPFAEAHEGPTIDALELLGAIRDGARPSWAPEIDRLCTNAARNGWTIDTLIPALNRDLGMGAGPGVTMMLLRRLTAGPPPRTRIGPTAEAAIVGHAPCNVLQHGDKCQICHCDKRHVQHLVITPMPDWFRTQMSDLFRGFGRIPDE